MKPTIQSNTRRGPRLPKTDYAFQASSLANTGGRCFGSPRPSFRAISKDYFKNEARHDFLAEASFFAAIVLTAAVPIVSGAYALAQFIR